MKGRKAIKAGNNSSLKFLKTNKPITRVIQTTVQNSGYGCKNWEDILTKALWSKVRCQGTSSRATLCTNTCGANQNILSRWYPLVKLPPVLPKIKPIKYITKLLSRGLALKTDLPVNIK